ncbi:MAG: hypothetical protein ABSG67_08815 [Thermoguttaceae bacterium]
MSTLQHADGGGRSNLSPSRARHIELAWQRSAYTPKTMTANAVYASAQYLLPPTSNDNIVYSTVLFAGPLQGTHAVVAQPIRLPLPVPATSLISLSTPQIIGKMPATIGGGVTASAIEKPFANFNLPAVNDLNGVRYSANPYGIHWTWERDTYRLIDLSSRRVLREWDGGTVINLRYGSNGHLRLGGQNFFMNQGGCFQNDGH